jgi:hypothetical protein
LPSHFQVKTTRMIRTAVVGTACIVGGVAQADCDAPATQAQLAGIAIEARSAFEAMDQAMFVSQMSQLNQTIPCLREIIEPMGASTIHLLMGLDSFGQKDLEGATLAFAAARSASSGYQMPDNVAPAGHPLHAAFATIPVDNPETQDVSVRPGMTLYIDGKEATARPTVWPALVQLTDADGRTQQTMYLSGSDPIPGAPAPEIPQVKEKEKEKEKEKDTEVDVGDRVIPMAGKSVLPSSFRTPLLGVAGTAVLTTAVLQIMASRSAQAYWDEGTGLSELDDLRSRTNSLNSASVATGVISVGALAAFSLTWEW